MKKSEKMSVKYSEINQSEKTWFQNWWDAGKAVLKGKLIAINANIKRKKIPNEESTKLKVSRWKEIRSENKWVK